MADPDVVPTTAALMGAAAMADAAALLDEHWRDGTTLDALPARVRPASRSEGYAIQALLPGETRGWKIAATSAAGQQHINVDGPLAGRLLADRLIAPGEPIRLGANRMLVAEFEFVFRIGRALAPREAPFGMDEVLDAVAGLHLGMEVPDSRFSDFTAVGAAQLIADNACAAWFVLGAELDRWREIDLAAHELQGRSDAGPIHDGIGRAVLGDPRLALTWLANELRQHGVTLGVGQIVTTGTCIVPLPIAPGVSVVGDYGRLGQLSATFR